MKNVYAVIDTESTKTHPFDVSYTIITKDKKTLFTRSMLIEDIFNDARNIRNSFYGFKWFDSYPYLLASQKVSISSIRGCHKNMTDDFKKYGVTHIVAYNINHDIRHLDKLFAMEGLDNPACLTKHKYIDLWLMSCEIIGTLNSYKQFCLENNLYSNAMNFHTNSSSMVSYTKGRVVSVPHTGYGDSIEEAELLLNLLSRKRKYTQNKIDVTCWKIVNKVA